MNIYLRLPTNYHSQTAEPPPTSVKTQARVLQYTKKSEGGGGGGAVGRYAAALATAGRG